MSEQQLYPWKPMSRSERLEAARFGIFDDPPAARQVPDDVAALVAEAHGWTMPQIVNAPSVTANLIARLGSALAALEVSSRTVAPNRETVLNIVYGELEHMEVPGSAVMFMNASSVTDALFAAGLWQAAPVIDRDALHSEAAHDLYQAMDSEEKFPAAFAEDWLLQRSYSITPIPHDNTSGTATHFVLADGSNLCAVKDCRKPCSWDASEQTWRHQ